MTSSSLLEMIFTSFNPSTVSSPTAPLTGSPTSISYFGLLVTIDVFGVVDVSIFFSIGGVSMGVFDGIWVVVGEGWTFDIPSANGVFVVAVVVAVDVGVVGVLMVVVVVGTFVPLDDGTIGGVSTTVVVIEWVDRCNPLKLSTALTITGTAKLLLALEVLDPVVPPVPP